MKQLASLLLSSGAVKFGEFTLTSGRKSSYYVDVKKASTKPEILHIIAREMATMVQDENLLAGMELGAVPVVVAVALETDKPYLILRKGERKHGTGKNIEGDFSAGQEVLVIEDVATTGGSVVKSADILRKAGIKVNRALVVVDREEGAAEALEKVDIKLVSLVRISEMTKG